MNYQRIILSGNVSTDAKIRKSKKGDITFLTFSVGVSNGKDRSTYFPIIVFGQLGTSLAPHITKSRQVLLEGRVEMNDGFTNIIADRVELGTLPPAPTPVAASVEKIEKSK
jgi:single-stranded DNA-binding protein